MKNLVISSDSSCSAVEDFIEYLWTSMSWEFSPDVESLGREEGSRIITGAEEKSRRILYTASGKTPG
jgi:hypothetical protein